MGKKFDFDIGVIGGGAAGLTVAAGAARLGARTLLVEREAQLGGDCLHYGCVPSKTLIASAKHYHLLKHSSRFGLPELTVPPVDFRQVADRIRQVIGEIQQHDSPERFCRLGAEVVFGPGRFCDEHTLEVDGLRQSARSWVVATGSSPAPASLPALAGLGCLTNREIFSLDRLPPRLLGLGAGPIAIEMAQAFQRLGSQVTVIQRSDQILTREDRDVADALMACLQGEGIEFLLGATVLTGRRLAGGSRELTIRLASGEEVRRGGDEVLLALGRVANIEGLGLELLGISADRRGIAVDRRLRTAHAHIYAAGDVNGVYQFTHAAGYEGGVALTNAVLHLPRKCDYTWMPWCTYTDPELASVGMNELRAREAGISYSVWSTDFAANDRALAEGTGRGRIKLLLDARERPLGVQILGPAAGELLAEWLAVIQGGMRLSTLAGVVHPYPTLSESNKRLASDLMGGKLFSPKVRQGLKLLFQLKGPLAAPCSHLRKPASQA